MSQPTLFSGGFFKPKTSKTSGEIKRGVKPEEIEVPADVLTCKKNLFQWLSQAVAKLNSDQAGVAHCWEHVAATVRERLQRAGRATAAGMIDMGVYADGRAFRLLGSTKLADGRSRAFTLLGERGGHRACSTGSTCGAVIARRTGERHALRASAASSAAHRRH